MFDRCCVALGNLANYPSSFMRIVRHPEEISEGSLFAPLVTHFGFVSVHPCRVIYTVREADCYGFGFGTLPGHAESGEERFLIRLDGDVVHYEVQAFSRPVGALPRLGAPIVRCFQRRFQRETVQAMRDRARA